MSTKYDNTRGKEFWEAQQRGASYRKPKAGVKISLPPGDGIKLLNMAEVSSPGGVSIVLKLPFPMSEGSLGKISESIKKVGGTVEIEN